MHGFRSLCAAVVCARALAAPSFQVPLKDEDSWNDRADDAIHVGKKRPLHGKFLQITGKATATAKK